MLNAKSELKSPFGSLLSCSILNSNYYSDFNCRRIINKKMAQNSKISIIEGYIAPEGYSETEKITHQTKRSEK